MLMHSARLSLDAIIALISCLCSTTDVRQDQVSLLLNTDNFTWPQRGNSSLEDVQRLENLNVRLAAVEAGVDDLIHMLQKSLSDTANENCDSIAISNDQSVEITYKLLVIEPFPALCKAVDPWGNWLVIQTRFNGAENFYRDWETYKQGFGAVEGEFFIGLEVLHQITASTPHELLVLMKRNLGDLQAAYAHYKVFRVQSESEGYALKVAGYEGDAGDALARQSGLKFCTFDRDNDQAEDRNCAYDYHGAWWFGNDSLSHLNGEYKANGKAAKPGDGILWHSLTANEASLKFVEMLIRPSAN